MVIASFSPAAAARLICVCLILSGCEAEGPAASGSPLPSGAPTAIAEAPIVTVGEPPSGPGQEFYRVVDPFLLPGGSVAVPLAGDGTIRVFDRSGALVASHGAPGEGPGEFMGLSAAWAYGDTIEAFDGRLRRVVRFAPDGHPETVGLDAIGSAQVAVPVTGGAGWVVYGVKAAQTQPMGRDLVAVHRFGRDGSHLGEVHEVEGMRRHTFEGGSGPDPLSPRAIVRARDGIVYVAETLTPRIAALDPVTGVRRMIEWTPRERMSAADAARAVRAEAASSGIREERLALLDRQLDALTGDERVSVFWDFLVDEQGFIWIRDYDPARHSAALGGLAGAGAGGQWSILGPDGTPVGTISLPAELEPVAIGWDRVVGIRRDELDIESVRVYALQRAPGP